MTSVAGEGRLLQINTSKGGLPKVPVAEPVQLSHVGVPGDMQRNLKYHGGPDKAVLMLASEVLDELRAKGFPVVAGSLGENLTVAGIDPKNWRSGQRWRVGDAVIELTTLRQPCKHLYPYGTKIGKELWQKGAVPGSEVWGFGGFYARVVQAGEIAEGAPVLLVSDVA